MVVAREAVAKKYTLPNNPLAAEVRRMKHHPCREKSISETILDVMFLSAGSYGKVRSRTTIVFIKSCTISYATKKENEENEERRAGGSLKDLTREYCNMPCQNAQKSLSLLCT